MVVFPLRCPLWVLPSFRAPDGGGGDKAGRAPLFSTAAARPTANGRDGAQAFAFVSPPFPIAIRFG
jgi:hypothetical protein